MLFFRHPRPVVDGRTHAVQVVPQEAGREALRTVLIVDGPAVTPCPAHVPVPTAQPSGDVKR